MNETATYGQWTDIFDLGSLYLSFTSMLIIYYTSRIMDPFNKVLSQDPELQNQLVTIRTGVAIVYPLIASAGLLLFFYFFGTVTLLLFISISLSAITEIVFSRLKHTHIYIPCVGRVPFTQVLSFIFGLGILTSWFITGHWFLNNLIGMSLVTVSLLFIRIPNGKIASLILILLFFYDIFWVFYSSSFFGDNVMLSVATKKANNPLAIFLGVFGLDDWVAKQLDPPIKLLSWNGHLLGLGDIFLPGMVICLAKRFDQYKMRQGKHRITLIYAMVWYGIGLLIAQIFATVYRVGQPALLYIVPCTLFGIFFYAYRQGEWRELWHGVQDDTIWEVVNVDPMEEEV